MSFCRGYDVLLWSSISYIRNGYNLVNIKENEVVFHISRFQILTEILQGNIPCDGLLFSITFLKLAIILTVSKKFAKTTQFFLTKRQGSLHIRDQ